MYRLDSRSELGAQRRTLLLLIAVVVTVVLTYGFLTAHELRPSPSLHDTLDSSRHRDDSQTRPGSVRCPSDLLRIARDKSAIDAAERAWVVQRKERAATALRKWIASVDGFDARSLIEHAMPTLAVAHGNGGEVALALSAGVVMGMEKQQQQERWPYVTAGLMDAVVYEAGNSGGNYILAARASTNSANPEALMEDVWLNTLDRGICGNTSLSDSIMAFVRLQADAGHHVNSMNVLGEHLAALVLRRGDEHAGLSDVLTMPRFRNAAVPLPILTLRALNQTHELCAQPEFQQKLPLVEVTPFEVGSPDLLPAAFVRTQYLGSRHGACRLGGDDYASLLGATASYAPLHACNWPVKPFGSPGYENNDLPCIAEPLELDEADVRRRRSASMSFNVPNYMYGLDESDGVDRGFTTRPEISLIDAGLGEHSASVPIEPLLRRKADIIFTVLHTHPASDKDRNFALGTTAAAAMDMTNMPRLGESEDAVRSKTAPLMYGCFEDGKATIVEITSATNYNMDVPGMSVGPMHYPAHALRKRIMAGASAIAQDFVDDGGKGWAVCLACLFLGWPKNDPRCGACQEKHCVR